MTNFDGAWIMATVIPFPITKLAEDNDRPFAVVNADIVRAGGADIVRLADHRTAHAIRHPIESQELEQDWTWRTL